MTDHRSNSIARKIALTGTAAAALTAFAAAPAAAETRSYVVSWFTEGMYSQEGDCPGGENPRIEEQWVKDLMDLGKTEEEAGKIVVAIGNGDRAAHEIIINRGRINGQPVNAYNNPQTVKDPMMKSVDGKFGFGFDLDKRGAGTPGSFEDPETHDKGVDNQLFRALGCIHNYRAAPPDRASDTEQWWYLIQDSQQAWLLSINSDDFSKDGPATLTFDRALEHPSRDANSNTRPNMTYRIDPDPRSHLEVKGELKNKVFHAATDQTLFMVGDVLVLQSLELHKLHARIKLLPDGSIDGFIGGYEPWLERFYAIGHGGNNFEQNVGHDLPGIYHLLRRNADAEPDPKTGQNMAISATWRIEAVPAYAVPVSKDSKLQASNKK